MTGRERLRKTTGKGGDGGGVALETGGDLHLMQTAVIQRGASEAKPCSTELYKINPLTAGSVWA